MKTLACCFTGHRHLPANQISEILKRTDEEIDRFIQSGVTVFISGGAIGFDQLAAMLIVFKKEKKIPIKLRFALPCRHQDHQWSLHQKTHLQSLLSHADEIIYVSEEYDANCMKKRNLFMVNHATHCICALLKDRSGTGQTVRYAEKQNLSIVNVAK